METIETKRRAASIYKWALDKITWSERWGNIDKNALYREGRATALFDIMRKSQEQASKEQQDARNGNEDPYMAVIRWLEEKQRTPQGYSQPKARYDGYENIIGECLKFCRFALDGDMYALRSKTLIDRVDYLTDQIEWEKRIGQKYASQFERLTPKNDFHGVNMLTTEYERLTTSIENEQKQLDAAKRNLGWFEAERKTGGFQNDNRDIDGQCMFIDTATGDRCEHESDGGTRWCKVHKDEWCDLCGRHATRIVFSPEGWPVGMCGQCQNPHLG